MMVYSGPSNVFRAIYYLGQSPISVSKTFFAPSIGRPCIGIGRHDFSPI